jgi:hypothetical protein
MSSSSAFSDRERAYHAYKERQEFIRQQHAIQCALDEARAAKEAALQSTEPERKAEEATLQRQEAILRWNEVARRAREAALQWQEAERKAEEAILQAKEIELQAKEARRKAREAALAEVERLTALLQQKEV